LAKSDEGEFELILGNRQLISVFLIVVVLLGVFFSMGYIVGRNSTATTAEAAHTGKPAPTDTSAADSQPSSSPSTPAQEPAPAPADTGPSSPAPAATHPAEEPAPVKPAPEKPAPMKPAPVKPAPVVAVKPKPTPSGPPSTALASVTGDPAAGNYWQVVATSRPDAEIISEALTKKGFHTVVTPASREGVFRVLVGPYQNAESQAQARTNLEAAGFKHSINKKY